MYKPISYQIEGNLKKALLDEGAVVVRLVLGKDAVFVRDANGKHALEVGMGDAKEPTRRMLMLLCRKVVHYARIHGLRRIIVSFPEFCFKQIRMKDAEIAELLAVNFEMANFEFVKYKTPPPEGWKFVEEIIVAGRATKEVKDGFLKGRIIAEEVNACRILANTPGGEMTPRLLADAAWSAVKNLPVEITVLGKREMEKLGMGGVLGVAKGSEEEPQFITLEYRGGKISDSPVVLVGKGVTFDTGGLNLKPTEAIYEMHMDMSGGAAVMHAVAAAARLRIKKNIVGLIPAVENMPSGSSYHPGDVLRSLSGKTIEVLNTDAEGRIILADGITYAKRYNPRLVVDAATLTGAAMVALGQRCSAIFTDDEKLEQMTRQIGEETGDYVWPLPLWSEYEEDIQGTFGDLANTGKTRYGGAIHGAKFLHMFAKELSCPWMHIDIAPRMTSIEGEYLAKGAAGAPVRLLVKLLETL